MSDNKEKIRYIKIKKSGADNIGSILSRLFK
jgi:hypothetical protein